MTSFLSSPGRLFLICEAFVLFILMPLLLSLSPSRLLIHLMMWGAALYAAYILSLMPGFSWKKAWQGSALTRRDFQLIALRFLISTVGVLLLTNLIDPQALFAFPLKRPFFWIIVLILYPLLSVIPQELVFRSFFFRRYKTIFPRDWAMIGASAFVFGFIHIVFHNPISPLLSAFCGVFLASSYLAHQSLKRVALEHALYGNMVFTIGLGLYFIVGHHS